MALALEFVFADGSGKPKQADRPRIRSRCMQGKNKRDASRRSLRISRREAALQKEAAAVAKLPPSLPGDMVLAELADNVGLQSREMLFKIFTCKTLDQAMSPLEHCVHFPVVETGCFDWLFRDAAFLHALLLTSSMMTDFANSMPQQPGRKTYFHLRKTIALLNDKIGEQDAHKKDSTLYVVVTLAMMAAVFGDWPAASAHIAGLRSIVKLRGGIRYLKSRPKLHFKLDRIDLARTLSSGDKPCFVSDPIPWDSMFPTLSSGPGVFPDLQSPAVLEFERLVTVYQDLQYLSRKINENVHTDTRWSGDSFQVAVNSIQSRLLSLSDALQDPFAECVRMAMLAFLTTLFRVPGKNVPYTHLKIRYKELFPTKEEEISKDSRSDMLFWVFMIGAISILHRDEEWLSSIWRLFFNGITPAWEESKKRLMGFIWIECIHDGPAKSLSRKLASRTRKTKRTDLQTQVGL